MRFLEWDGCPNVRDLGGLKTPASPTGHTQFGRAARGPRRELLTASGWASAKAWGLKSVVDLRCAHEVGSRENDPDVAPTAWDGVVITNAPTEDQDDPEFRRTCFPILDSPEYWEHNWRILPHLVRHTMETIADSGPGTLIHCAAGRDRTGMISALLLGNAGVRPQDVAEDYAESVRTMAGTAHHASLENRQSRWTDQEVRLWLKDKLPIVEDTAASAPATLARLGLSARVRTSLRELLTAPPAA